MTHEIVKCREHGTVYSNCRCASPGKVTRLEDCHCTVPGSMQLPENQASVEQGPTWPYGTCPSCGSGNPNVSISSPEKPLPAGVLQCPDSWHDLAPMPGSPDLPKPAEFSVHVIFAKVGGLWRYEGMFLGDESRPVRDRIKRIVEEENGAGTYWEATLP